MADIGADLWGWSSNEANNDPAGSTAVGTGLAPNLRAIQAAVRAALEPLTSVAGTNTITASMAGLTAYASGLRTVFLPANTNTGATTININSLGAKNVYHNAAACAGGELVANVPAEIEYDGTQFNIVANGSAVLQGLASAKGDILAATAARTLARLAVGSDGARLLADSSASPGVSWQTAWFKVGSITRDLTTATGSASYTGVGFKPKAVVFFGGFSTNSISASLGFSDASSHVALYLADFDTPKTWVLSTTTCIFLVTASGAYGKASVSSFDTDGFTLSWTKTGSPTGTTTVGYLAFR